MKDFMIIARTLRTLFLTLCTMVIFADNARPMQAELNVPGFGPDDSSRILQLAQEISQSPQDWDHASIYDRLEFIADDDEQDCVVEAMKLLQKTFLQALQQGEEVDYGKLQPMLLGALAEAEQQIARGDEVARKVDVTAACAVTITMLIFIIKLLLSQFEPCIGCGQDYYFTGQRR